MSFEWRTVRLGDLINIKHGYAFKGEFFCDSPTSYQLITPGNFAIGGGFQTTKNKYYNGPIPDDYILKPGDLIVTMTDLSKAGDTLGYGALVPCTQGTTWLHNQRVGLVEPKIDAAIYIPFVHYLLRSSEYRHWVISSATGSTVKHTSPGRIGDFNFLLPPINEQKHIAVTLGALDDRITLLRETNNTLESIAQAIFKSWFVDFDPVHSKAKGLAPEGMDEATAALFPDSFEETELGMVPKGWTLGLMSDFMQLHKKTIDPSQHPHKLYQHFSLPAFDKGKRPVLELGADIKSNKTSVPANAVMVSKLNPRTPRIWLPSSVEKDAICSTEFLPFVPCGNGTTSFIYCKLSDPFFSDTVAQFVTGTSNSHQRIRSETVLNLSTIVPSSEPIVSFDNIATGIFSRVKINEQQAQNLSDLRDTLLPRLISGQLRIEEAQEIAESV